MQWPRSGVSTNGTTGKNFISIMPGTRRIGALLMGGFMKTINQVVYCSLDTPAARSAAKKMSQAKADEVVFLEEDEFKAMLRMETITLPPMSVVEDGDMDDL